MSSLRRFRDPLYSPFFHTRFFDDFDFDRPMRTPYWAEKSLVDGQKFADGVGEVVDTEDNFKVELDVSHFRPEELKVNVVEDELVIEGNHEEKTDKYGKVSFTTNEALLTRKYHFHSRLTVSIVELCLATKICP